MTNLYPQLAIDLKKLEENVSLITEKCHKQGISVMGVTKVFCAQEEAARAFVEGGVDYLADSRVENLIDMAHLSPEKVLLRLPMPSEAQVIVQHVDISLNSELKTIKALDQAAKLLDKTHRIILMVDLGDLREGIWPSDFDATIREILTLDKILLEGIGVNLTCYGGVVPKTDNLSQLTALNQHLKDTFGVTVKMVSGGNSSFLYLLDQGGVPEGINNLRLGEALVLGRETAYGDQIPGTHADVFQLKAEIIELKQKPSVPIGEIGMDAFGNKPTFVDKGIRLKGILAVGRQDVHPDNLIPLDENLTIIGSSSDHMIVDFTDSKTDYHVGDIITFNVEYGALLSLSTSPYIKKVTY